MKLIRWIPIAALALVACGDGSGPRAGRGNGFISLSVSSQRPSSTTATTRVALVGDSTFLMADADTVIVRSVDLVVRRIKLKPNEVAGCVSDSAEQEHEDSAETDDSSEAEDDSIADEDDEGCEEIEAGPVLVSLPLGTTAIEALVDVAAPAGQYDELEFKIHAPELPRDSAFLTANPDFAGVSIRVTGTFSQGGTRTDFTYVQDLEVEEELNIDPPLAVAEGSAASLTLRFDISGWFAGPDGNGVIDPASANAGGPNEELIKNNILRSIKAFEDGDEDGHDDHDAADDADHGEG